MKLKLLVGAALLAAATFAFSAEGITWAKNEAEAFKQAASSKKLIMVDFYTDWCGWCKKLDSDTYSDAAVGKLSQKFISLKTNAEKEGTALAKKHSVTGFPTILFLDAKGEVQGKIVGYMPPKDFIPAVEKVLDTYAKLPALTAAVKKNPNDGKSLAQLAEVKAGQGDIKGAEEYALQAQKAGLKGDDMAKAFNAVGEQYLGESSYIKALNNYNFGMMNAVDPKLKSKSMAAMLEIFQQMKKIGEDYVPRFAKMIIDLKDADPADVEKAKKALEPPKPVEAPKTAGDSVPAAKIQK